MEGESRSKRAKRSDFSGPSTSSSAGQDRSVHNQSASTSSSSAYLIDMPSTSSQAAQFDVSPLLNEINSLNDAAVSTSDSVITSQLNSQSLASISAPISNSDTSYSASNAATSSLNTNPPNSVHPTGQSPIHTQRNVSAAVKSKQFDMSECNAKEDLIPKRITWFTSLIGSPRKSNSASAAIGSTIYLFGGYCEGFDFSRCAPMDVYALDTLNYRWKPVNYHRSEIKYFPDALSYSKFYGKDIPWNRYGHTCVEIKGKIYIWGGRNDTQACNKLYTFDPLVGMRRCHQSGKIPPSRDSHAACAVGDHSMAIFGGYENQAHVYSHSLFIFNTLTQVWVEIITSDPPSHRDQPTLNFVDGKIYMYGGRTDASAPGFSNSPIFDANMYRLELGSAERKWKAIKPAPCPEERRGHVTCMLNNKRILMASGVDDNAGFKNDFWIFDTETEEWHRPESHKLAHNKYSPNLPIDKHGVEYCLTERRRPQMHLVNGRLFYFGGNSSYRELMNRVENFRNARAARPHNDNPIQRRYPKFGTQHENNKNDKKPRDLADLQVGVFGIASLEMLTFRSIMNHLDLCARFKLSFFSLDVFREMATQAKLPRGMIDLWMNADRDNSIKPFYWFINEPTEVSHPDPDS